MTGSTPQQRKKKLVVRTHDNVNTMMNYMDVAHIILDHLDKLEAWFFGHEEIKDQYNYVYHVHKQLEAHGCRQQTAATTVKPANKGDDRQEHEATH